MQTEELNSNAPRKQTTEFLSFDSGVAEYDGNPCIGALGKILSPEEIDARLTPKIVTKPSELERPPHIRMHCIRRFSKFNMPTEEQRTVFHTIGLMIRQGYLHRNPLDPEFRRQWLEDKPLVERGEMPPERYDQTPSLGMCVTGGAGNGKTVAVAYALSAYPVAMQHYYQFGDVIRSFCQVPYIKLDLPADASLKELAIEFFTKLGGRVGRDLNAEWRINGCSESGVQPKIYAACRQYNVGMIVVDEAQFLSEHRKGQNHVVNYFVRLMNTIGVPIVLIGTEKLGSLIGSALESGRRFTEIAHKFGPFGPGVLWKEFIDRLCALSLVKGVVDFEGRAEVYYELCGGIPDLAVKLSMYAQTRVMGRPVEDVDETVLNETAGLLFHFVEQGIADAKRTPKGEDALHAALAKVDRECQERINAECARVGAAPLFAVNAAPALEVRGSVETPLNAAPTPRRSAPRLRPPAKPRREKTNPALIKAQLELLGLR